VRIAVVGLTRGDVEYRDPRAGWAIAVRALAVRARPAAGALDLEVEAGRVEGAVGATREALEGVEVEGRLGPEVVLVRRLVARWEGQPLQAGAEVRAPWTRPELAGTVRATLPLAALATRAGAPWPIDGLARVDADLRGPLAAPRVTAEIAVPDLTAGPLRARAVALRAGWADGTLSVEDLRARALGGELGGSLVLPLAAPERARLTLRVRDAALPALEALVGRPLGLQGRLTGSGELAGDLRRPLALGGRARLDLAVTLPAPLARLGPATVAAELESRGGGGAAAGIQVTRLDAVWAAGRLSAAGRLGFDGSLALEGRLAADPARLAALWEVPGIAGPEGAGRAALVVGPATLAVQARGRVDTPVLAGRLEVPTLAVAGLTLGDLRVPFRFAGRTLALEAATVALGASRLAVTGTAAWDDGAWPALALDLEARALRLEDLAPALPAAARGTGPVTVQARLEGTLPAWRASATLAAPRLVWPQAPVEAVRARVAAGPAGLEVAALEARVHGAPVRVAGTLSWAGAGEASAELGPVSLADLPGLPAGLAVTGTARGRVTAARRGGVASATAQGAVAGATLAGLPLGDGTLGLTLRDGAVTADLAFPERRLAASARGALGPGGTLVAALAVDDLAVAPLVQRLAPGDADGVSGTVSVRADARVPVDQPAAAEATVRLAPLRLAIAGEALEGRGPAIARWDGTRVTLERLELGGRFGTVSASGTAVPGGALDVRLRGRLRAGPGGR
jgi:hypothetical protein